MYKSKTVDDLLKKACNCNETQIDKKLGLHSKEQASEFIELAKKSSTSLQRFHFLYHSLVCWAPRDIDLYKEIVSILIDLKEYSAANSFVNVTCNRNKVSQEVLRQFKSEITFAEDKDALLNKGLSLISAKKYNEAKFELQRLSGMGKEYNYNKIMSLAVASLLAGDSDKCITGAKSINENDKDFFYFYVLGIAFFMKNDFEKAIDCCERMLSLVSINKQLSQMAQLKNAILFQCVINKTILFDEYVEKHIAHNATSEDNLRHLLLYALLKVEVDLNNNYNTVLSDYKSCVSMYKQDNKLQKYAEFIIFQMSILEFKVSYYRKENEFEKILELLKNLPFNETKPNDYKICHFLYLIGYIHAVKNDIDIAMDFFNAAIESDKDKTCWYFYVIQVILLIYNKKYAEASNLLMKAQQHFRNNEIIFYYHACCLIYNNNLIEDACQKLSEIYPSNFKLIEDFCSKDIKYDFDMKKHVPNIKMFSAYFEYEKCIITDNNTDLSRIADLHIETRIEEKIRLDFHIPNLELLKGLIAFENKDFNAALSLIEKSYELDKTNIGVRCMRALTNFHFKKFTEAIEDIIYIFLNLSNDDYIKHYKMKTLKFIDHNKIVINNLLASALIKIYKDDIRGAEADLYKPPNDEIINSLNYLKILLKCLVLTKNNDGLGEYLNYIEKNIKNNEELEKIFLTYSSIYWYRKKDFNQTQLCNEILRKINMQSDLAEIYSLLSYNESNINGNVEDDLNILIDYCKKIEVDKQINDCYTQMSLYELKFHIAKFYYHHNKFDAARKYLEEIETIYESKNKLEYTENELLKYYILVAIETENYDDALKFLQNSQTIDKNDTFHNFCVAKCYIKKADYVEAFKSLYTIPVTINSYKITNNNDSIVKYIKQNELIEYSIISAFYMLSTFTEKNRISDASTFDKYLKYFDSLISLFISNDFNLNDNEFLLEVKLYSIVVDYRFKKNYEKVLENSNECLNTDYKNYFYFMYYAAISQFHIYERDKNLEQPTSINTIIQFFEKILNILDSSQITNNIIKYNSNYCLGYMYYFMFDYAKSLDYFQCISNISEKDYLNPKKIQKDFIHAIEFRDLEYKLYNLVALYHINKSFYEKVSDILKELQSIEKNTEKNTELYFETKHYIGLIKFNCFESLNEQDSMSSEKESHADCEVYLKEVSNHKRYELEAKFFLGRLYCLKKDYHSAVKSFRDITDNNNEGYSKNKDRIDEYRMEALFYGALYKGLTIDINQLQEIKKLAESVINNKRNLLDCSNSDSSLNIKLLLNAFKYYLGSLYYLNENYRIYTVVNDYNLSEKYPEIPDFKYYEGIACVETRFQRDDPKTLVNHADAEEIISTKNSNENTTSQKLQKALSCLDQYIKQNNNSSSKKYLTSLYYIGRIYKSKLFKDKDYNKSLKKYLNIIHHEYIFTQQDIFSLINNEIDNFNVNYDKNFEKFTNFFKFNLLDIYLNIGINIYCEYKDMIIIQRNDYLKQAIELFNCVLERNEINDNIKKKLKALYYIGCCKYEIKDYDNAIKDFEEVSKNNNDDKYYYLSLYMCVICLMKTNSTDHNSKIDKLFIIKSNLNKKVVRFLEDELNGFHELWIECHFNFAIEFLKFEKTIKECEEIYEKSSMTENIYEKLLYSLYFNKQFRDMMVYVLKAEEKYSINNNNEWLLYLKCIALFELFKSSHEYSERDTYRTELEKITKNYLLSQNNNETNLKILNVKYIKSLILADKIESLNHSLELLMQLSKEFNNLNSSKEYDDFIKLFTDYDINYQISLVHMKLGNFDQAFEILNDLNSKGNKGNLKLFEFIYSVTIVEKLYFLHNENKTDENCCVIDGKDNENLNISKKIESIICNISENDYEFYLDSRFCLVKLYYVLNRYPQALKELRIIKDIQLKKTHLNYIYRNENVELWFAKTHYVFACFCLNKSDYDSAQAKFTDTVEYCENNTDMKDIKIQIYCCKALFYGHKNFKNYNELYKYLNKIESLYKKEFILLFFPDFYCVNGICNLILFENENSLEKLKIAEESLNKHLAEEKNDKESYKNFRNIHLNKKIFCLYFLSKTYLYMYMNRNHMKDWSKKAKSSLQQLKNLLTIITKKNDIDDDEILTEVINCEFPDEFFFFNMIELTNVTIEAFFETLIAKGAYEKAFEFLKMFNESPKSNVESSKLLASIYYLKTMLKELDKNEETETNNNSNEYENKMSSLVKYIDDTIDDDSKQFGLAMIIISEYYYRKMVFGEACRYLERAKEKKVDQLMIDEVLFKIYGKKLKKTIRHNEQSECERLIIENKENELKQSSLMTEIILNLKVHTGDEQIMKETMIKCNEGCELYDTNYKFLFLRAQCAYEMKIDDRNIEYFAEFLDKVDRSKQTRKFREEVIYSHYFKFKIYEEKNYLKSTISELEKIKKLLNDDINTENDLFKMIEIKYYLGTALFNSEKYDESEKEYNAIENKYAEFDREIYSNIEFKLGIINIIKKQPRQDIALNKFQNIPNKDGLIEFCIRALNYKLGYYDKEIKSFTENRFLPKLEIREESSIYKLASEFWYNINDKIVLKNIVTTRSEEITHNPYMNFYYSLIYFEINETDNFNKYLDNAIKQFNGFNQIYNQQIECLYYSKSIDRHFIDGFIAMYQKKYEEAYNQFTKFEKECKSIIPNQQLLTSYYKAISMIYFSEQKRYANLIAYKTYLNTKQANLLLNESIEILKNLLNEKMFDRKKFIYSYIAKAYFYLKESDGALKNLNECKRLNQNINEDFILIEGICYFRKKNYDESKRCFNQLINNARYRPYLEYYCAKIELENKEYSKALSLMKNVAKFLEKSKLNDTFYKPINDANYQIAKIYEKNKEFKDALNYYNKQTTFTKDYEKVYYEKATLIQRNKADIKEKYEDRELLNMYDKCVTAYILKREPWTKNRSNLYKTLIKNVSKQIFFSYSHKDKILVEKICEIFNNFGFDCWIDKENLRIGELLSKRIEEEIDKSKVIFCFFSKSYLKSENCKSEIVHSCNREKRMYPILIDKEVKWSDLFNDKVFRSENTNDENTNQMKSKSIEINPTVMRNIFDEETLYVKLQSIVDYNRMEDLEEEIITHENTVKILKDLTEYILSTKD